MMASGAVVGDWISHMVRLVSVMHWNGFFLVQKFLHVMWVLDMVHGSVSLLNVM